MNIRLDLILNYKHPITHAEIMLHGINDTVYDDRLPGS